MSAEQEKKKTSHSNDFLELILGQLKVMDWDCELTVKPSLDRHGRRSANVCFLLVEV